MKVRNDQDLLAAFHGGSYATVIPVSCDVDPKKHTAMMGTGMGKRAAAIWPELPRNLGMMLEVGGAHTYIVPVVRQPNQWTVCIPVRYSFNQKTDLDLLARTLEELVTLADTYGWEKVFIPRFGGAAGDRDWKTEARPLVARLLDDRFVVVHMDPPTDLKPAERPTAAPVVKKGAVTKAAAKRMAKK